MASSLTDFSHLPTSDRQESGVLPVIAASVFSPLPNKSARMSRADPLGSESSFCFCICSVSVSGGVAETVDETFRPRSLKRFTLTVETSDWYCRLDQLWGDRSPVPSSSIRPAAASSAIIARAFSGLTRNLNATVERDGSLPPFCDVMQQILNHALNSSGLSCCSFGSSTASSYARHQRLIAPSLRGICSVQMCCYCC
jgi:hypothetical protein